MYGAFLALKYSFIALFCTPYSKSSSYNRLKSAWCLNSSLVQGSAKKFLDIPSYSSYIDKFKSYTTTSIAFGIKLNIIEIDENANIESK